MMEVSAATISAASVVDASMSGWYSKTYSSGRPPSCWVRTPFSLSLP